VDYSPDPIWDTELAWELDGKMLRYLRTQRAMLKLQCFALHPDAHRELVGYVMLDLRQAQSIPAKEKWYP
jgi:centrosomal protein CEP120